MARRRDPVERADDGDRDLYDVSRWEPRSPVDWVAYAIYAALSYGWRAIVLLVTVWITLILLFQPAFLVFEEPWIGGFFALSIVPAALLAAFIWYTDVTTREPLGLLVVTFLLAVVFATIAAIVNSLVGPYLQAIPLVGWVLFFYLIVGPVEETVKLLAVRVVAFRSPTFDSVLDGAVYGAVAGLGFAAIENAIYITGTVVQADAGLFTAATGIASLRALVGPGHVIYSAIAGYYLGLAKFNRAYAGPLVVKGLLVAAFIHATYNVTVGLVPQFVATFYPVNGEVAFVGYVICFNLAAGGYLYLKVSRYRSTYRAVREDAGRRDLSPERTEFDPQTRQADSSERADRGSVSEASLERSGDGDAGEPDRASGFEFDPPLHSSEDDAAGEEGAVEGEGDGDGDGERNTGE